MSEALERLRLEGMTGEDWADYRKLILTALTDLKDSQKLTTLKAVIEYGLSQGQGFSADLGYIPLPPNVIEADKKALAGIS